MTHSKLWTRRLYLTDFTNLPTVRWFCIKDLVPKPLTGQVVYKIGRRDVRGHRLWSRALSESE